MEKRVLSFRVSEAEITALEVLQQPEDSSLGQTALRLLRSLIGVQPDTPVDAVDVYGIKNRVESLEEKLTDAIISPKHLSDFVNDIVDKRIQHLADALSEHENRLISIEESPVTGKATTQDVTPALPQDKEDAIAPKTTEENIDPATPSVKPSQKRVSHESYLTSALYRVKKRLNRPRKVNRLQITDKKIKAKILELYPDPQKCCCEEDIALVVKAITEENKKAIAPKATEDNVFSASVVKQLSRAELKSKATSIQTTFREKGTELSQTIIKEKILEMYPNPDDWKLHSDARKDVIRALERQHK